MISGDLGAPTLGPMRHSMIHVLPLRTKLVPPFSRCKNGTLLGFHFNKLCWGSHLMATRTRLARVMLSSLDPQASFPIRSLILVPIPRVILGIIIRHLMCAEIPKIMQEQFSYGDWSNLDTLNQMEPQRMVSPSDTMIAVRQWVFPFCFRLLEPSIHRLCLSHMYIMLRANSWCHTMMLK